MRVTKEYPQSIVWALGEIEPHYLKDSKSRVRFLWTLDYFKSKFVSTIRNKKTGIPKRVRNDKKKILPHCHSEPCPESSNVILNLSQDQGLRFQHLVSLGGSINEIPWNWIDAHSISFVDKSWSSRNKIQKIYT